MQSFPILLFRCLPKLVVDLQQNARKGSGNNIDFWETTTVYFFIYTFPVFELSILLFLNNRDEYCTTASIFKKIHASPILHLV